MITISLFDIICYPDIYVTTIYIRCYIVDYRSMGLYSTSSFYDVSTAPSTSRGIDWLRLLVRYLLNNRQLRSCPHLQQPCGIPLRLYVQAVLFLLSIAYILQVLSYFRM